MLCSSMYSSINAIDLGVKSRVFDIEEIDIRVYIIQQMAARVDLESHKRDMEEAAKKFYKELPRKNLSLSQNNLTKFVDPTRVYGSDFWAAQQNADGTFEWVKAIEAGQEVNWLEHSSSPMPIYFVFDASSKPQMDVARELIAKQIPLLNLVFIGGDVTIVNTQLGASVTYLNDAMIKEYALDYVPSLVRRGVGTYSTYYEVTRFKFDEFSVSQIEDILRD